MRNDTEYEPMLRSVNLPVAHVVKTTLRHALNELSRIAVGSRDGTIGRRSASECARGRRVLSEMSTQPGVVLCMVGSNCEGAE